MKTITIEDWQARRLDHGMSLVVRSPISGPDAARPRDEHPNPRDIVRGDIVRVKESYRPLLRMYSATVIGASFARVGGGRVFNGRYTPGDGVDDLTSTVCADRMPAWAARFWLQCTSARLVKDPCGPWYWQSRLRPWKGAPAAGRRFLAAAARNNRKS